MSSIAKRNDEVIFVAGHRGMVGSAIVRRLRMLGYRHILTASRDELDLRSQADVGRFFSSHCVDHVVLAAARVGGIEANSTLPADFIYDNLAIATNVIHAAHMADVQQLLFLGSSCIYPRMAEQPIHEDYLLTGVLEPTNEPYAIAKIAGIKLCESYNRQHGRDYRSVMPTNLYGPNDNFHPTHSHVIPALMRRFHEAVKNDVDEVMIWGSGTPRREFLHVDDLAIACSHVMEIDRATYAVETRPMLSHLNVGTGIDCSIRELAETMACVTGFRGRLVFDTSKPDGAPRKLLDISRMKRLGWQPSIDLKNGLHDTYSWYVTHCEQVHNGTEA